MLLLDDCDDALAALYNKILRFVERDLKSLMEVAEVFSARHRQSTFPAGAVVNGHGHVQTGTPEQSEGFEIMANVVLAEIAWAILEELGSVVFAAGRPDDFRQASAKCILVEHFMTSFYSIMPLPRISWLHWSFWHRRSIPWSPCGPIRRTWLSSEDGNCQCTSSFDGKTSSERLRRRYLQKHPNLLTYPPTVN